MDNRDKEVAALQSTIARYLDRITELESGRGEPVAYAMRSGLERIASRETATHSIYRSKNAPWDVPLFTAPPAPVAVPADLRKRLNDVWLFLDGQAELNGCVWGEKPEGRHTYWWRKELRAVIEDVNACLDATDALNEVRK